MAPEPVPSGFRARGLVRVARAVAGMGDCSGTAFEFRESAAMAIAMPGARPASNSVMDAL